jgi:hypothetical protein
MRGAEGTENTKKTAVAAREYQYLKCVKSWSPFERKQSGCGKLFTADSAISVCPDCGKALSVVRLGEPASDRVPRVVLEKCAKCASNIYAPPCVCGHPARPEYCGPCPCAKCCREAGEVYRDFLNGKTTLSALMRKAAGSGPPAGTLGKIFDDEIPF